MRSFPLIAFAVLFTFTLSAQSRDNVRGAMEAAADRQRSSVESAMKPALDRQRASIRKQAAVALEIAEDDAAAFLSIPWPKTATLEMPVALCDPLPKTEVDSLVALNAKRHGLQPNLLREVIRRESGFRPCAVSRAGAQGLMQLMPATADEFRVRDPFDPSENVAAGAKFLRSLLDRYGGDLRLALGAYNAGPGRVDAKGEVPGIPETRDYVKTILKTLWDSDSLLR